MRIKLENLEVVFTDLETGYKWVATVKPEPGHILNKVPDRICYEVISEEPTIDGSRGSRTIYEKDFAEVLDDCLVAMEILNKKQ